MDEATRKASVLIEALSWIRQFKDRYIVIKLGGSVMEERDAVMKMLTDVIFLQSVGCRPILVHGGGKAISKALSLAGLETRFVQGRRYTDEESLDIIVQVLGEAVCGLLTDSIERLGGQSIGLTDLDRCLTGERLMLPPESPDEEPVDLGFVGQVTGIHKERIIGVCAAGMIPVIPSIAVDADGGRLNVNADTAAAAVARLLCAEKLMFLSDVPGIFRDRDEPGSLISHLDAFQCRELIREGIIAAGMVPKVEAALDALDAGVRKIHIVDARLPHSVLLEIFSDRGIGTEIVPRSTDSQQTATV